MTRPFHPTHELVLTDRTRRNPRTVVLVMRVEDGRAFTADEWRDRRLVPDWSQADGEEWRYRGHRFAPEGWTTYRAKRLRRNGQPAMGPTTLRAGAEGTNLVKTYRVTASEWTEIQAGAKRVGKPVSRFVADAAIGEARKRR